MCFRLIAEKGSVKVFGDDKLAFKGQWVQFECQAAGWYPQPTLQWQVYDRKVNIYIVITLIFISKEVILRKLKIKTLFLLIPSHQIVNIPLSQQSINNTNSLSPCLGIGVEVSQGEYSISSEESGKSLFTVTSSLNVTAAKSSHVDCLAAVSALPTPMKSSVRLTVGEGTPPSCFALNNICMRAGKCKERNFC